MPSTESVIKSFEKYSDDLLARIKEINKIDATDDIKGDKMFRLIRFWFKNYGKVPRT